MFLFSYFFLFLPISLTFLFFFVFPRPPPPRSPHPPATQTIFHQSEGGPFTRGYTLRENCLSPRQGGGTMCLAFLSMSSPLYMQKSKDERNCNSHPRKTFIWQMWLWPQVSHLLLFHFPCFSLNGSVKAQITPVWQTANLSLRHHLLSQLYLGTLRRLLFSASWKASLLFLGDDVSYICRLIAGRKFS